MLQTWADKWQMVFNPVMYNILHIGKSNRRETYTVTRTTLNSRNVTEGYWCQNPQILKVTTQIELLNKSFGVLVLIGQILRVKNSCCSFITLRVRPYLWHCVQFLSPYYRKVWFLVTRGKVKSFCWVQFADTLESVQNWFAWQPFKWIQATLMKKRKL